MIVRTVTAQCDRKACDSTLVIDPDTPQAWLAVTDAGWALDYDAVPGEIATICPLHEEV